MVRYRKISLQQTSVLDVVDNVIYQRSLIMATAIASEREITKNMNKNLQKLGHLEKSKQGVHLTMNQPRQLDVGCSCNRTGSASKSQSLPRSSFHLLKSASSSAEDTRSTEKRKSEIASSRTAGSEFLRFAAT